MADQLPTVPSSSRQGSSSTSQEVLSDIASSTSSPPCQPVNITFPVTYFSGKARSFNPDWFKLYPWLEYSAKRALQENEKEAESVLEVYHQLLQLQTAFPTLTKIFKIALTIVVSTAQCERSFSALTRIKTHLRTTMTDQRLADISLLSIERDLTSDSSFFEDTIREFEGVDNNRTIILS